MKPHYHDEEMLEPLVRWFRFQKGLIQINCTKPAILLDLGAGPKIRFYHFATKGGIVIKKYIAMDPLVKVNPQNKDIRIIKKAFSKTIPLKANSVDLVVGLAFLEHINNPKAAVNEAIRVVRKGGKIIFTTPTPRAKIVLEFLAFRLGLISRREIEEHNIYFDKQSLEKLIDPKLKKKIRVRHEYFEFGLNNLFVIEKK